MIARNYFHLISLLALATPLFAKESRFFLGTYTSASGSQGIYEGSLDSETGKLGPITLAAAADNPSFLAFSADGNYLYAALEKPGVGGVEAFRCGRNGSLTRLNERSAEGIGTCHVSYNAIGSEVMVANYGSGSIACFGVDRDGAVGARTALIIFKGSGPNVARQQSPHAHSIYPGPDGNYVYACDLGSDKIWIFRLSGRGILEPGEPAFARVPPGGGPRHLAFEPGGRFVYAVDEMGHAVTVFERDGSTNGLTARQTISVLPAGVPDKDVRTAEIALHPSGKWLYVSNRGCETISVLAVGADGRLALIQSVPAEVKGPRSFTMDRSGKWLIVAGQDDNRIVELKIDPATGRLSSTGESARVGSPVCVLFEKAGRGAP